MNMTLFALALLCLIVGAAGLDVRTAEPRSPRRDLVALAASADAQAPRDTDPGWPATLPLVTVDTRSGNPFVLRGAKLLGEWARPTAINVGAGEKWVGLAATKSGLWLRWLESQPDPEQLAVLIDGGDLIFGGCTPAELLRRYRAIVRASDGAPVVVSAELGACPKRFVADKRFQQFAAREVAVLDQLGLAHNHNWTQGWTQCDMTGPGPCSTPARYKFMNYGFLMGPVGSLRGIVRSVAAAPNVFDQDSAMEYMFKNPDEVTLDYGGSLSLSLYNFGNDPVGKRSLVAEAATEAGARVLRNKAIGQTTCFIHGNGPTKKLLIDYASMLDGEIGYVASS